jgi:hypothetical protein
LISQVLSLDSGMKYAYFLGGGEEKAIAEMDKRL